jgi:beta-lactamase regulating signal transducer with metallopeptidase domain
MNLLLSLVSQHWLQAFGWTLVHSLWQSSLCAAALIIALRFIPLKHSNTRYIASISGMFLILMLSLGTFGRLLSATSPEPHSPSGTLIPGAVSSSYQPDVYSSVSSLLAMISSLIQSNLSFIVILWSVGAILFSLRVVGGWWYIVNLRRHGIDPPNELNNHLKELAARLGITRVVTLVESGRVQAPLVMGYLKPVILMPIGMYSGLSTDQLESILIHELIHIKRGDYLVNIVQSFLEGLYFFNPFMWIVSGIIRREREHCCDDAVIHIHGNPMAYARALTSLQEVRLKNAGLALSLAENKKQLLTRIKRIMEKSVQHYSSRERIIPVILFVVGLFCASWITIQSGKSEKDVQSHAKRQQEQGQVADTTVKKQDSGFHYNRISTTGPDGDVSEEIAVELDEVMNISPMLGDLKLDLDLSPLVELRDLDIALAPLADLELDIALDSIPGPGLNWSEGRDWEEFSRMFEKNFSESFGEFYENHGEELRAMMEEMRNQFDHRFNEELLTTINEKMIMQEALVKKQVEVLERNQAELVRKSQAMAELQKDLGHWDEEHAANLIEIEKKMKAVEKSMKVFEKELKEQLVKDGYVKPNEEIDINVTQDKIEINGKSIKPADEKKYRDLLKKISEKTESLDSIKKQEGGRRE